MLMDAYENKYGGKPDLTETSESHPHVYGRFVRYVALMELVLGNKAGKPSRQPDPKEPAFQV